MRIYTCFVLVDSGDTLAGKKKKKKFLSNLKEQREKVREDQREKAREEGSQRRGREGIENPYLFSILYVRNKNN